jgi:GR25 family glycosyltransferase involved in LPS biosynthesis
MVSAIKTYILYSPLETDRTERVKALSKLFSDFTISNSIYPSQTHIPFLNKLIEKSKERTGSALRASEVACLLGHRQIWRDILKTNIADNEHVLVMESDSKINNFETLNQYFNQYTKPYDLFFWGAWEGNLKIKRSTIKYYHEQYKVGEPLIKTLYCMYGYSLNKKAARYLLQQTRKIAYPVDIFKQFIEPGNIQIGAIKKEVIGTWLEGSYIREMTTLYTIKRKLLLFVLNIRNSIKAYFS